MVIKIDFQSEEALYMQLRNQIILGIATSVIQEGDSRRPSGSWRAISASTCTRSTRHILCCVRKDF